MSVFYTVTFSCSCRPPHHASFNLSKLGPTLRAACIPGLFALPEKWHLAGQTGPLWVHWRQLRAHRDPISSMCYADHLGCFHACLAEGNVLSMGMHPRQESCMTQPFALLGPVEATSPPPQPPTHHCWLIQQRASWLATHSHLFSLKRPFEAEDQLVISERASLCSRHVRFCH